MAPGILIAQPGRYVDLDGPLLQRLNRDPPIRFESGLRRARERTLWG
jgi:L-Ala-D/L-Glu epimerase